MNICGTSCRVIRWRSALLAFFLALSPSTAAAQINTGEISGIVRDSVGGVLPGATVTATHAATRRRSSSG